MRLRSIRVAAIHELPLQCVFLHQSYKAHLQTEMVLMSIPIQVSPATNEPGFLTNNKKSIQMT